MVEDVAYLVGVGEDAASAVLGGHAPHGTADIPVHLLVAYLVEPVGEGDELFGLLAQNLGDDGNGTPVGLREDIVDLFPCTGEVAMRQ